VFGRSSKTLNAQQAETVQREAREGAKNRPTPRRRDQEAANRRPLVVTDRKVARDLDKTKRREIQVKQRQAMVTGDEANLPARDKGPVKRYVRDYVDARWNVGEFMLPVMLVVLALSFIHSIQIFAVVSIGVYLILLAAIVDGFLMWRRLKKRLAAKFGADHTVRGLAMYAAMRGFQLRRSRMPRPQVKRGDYPA
jgi:maltodextrin utilization protein YvdJ